MHPVRFILFSFLGFAILLPLHSPAAPHPTRQQLLEQLQQQQAARTGTPSSAPAATAAPALPSSRTHSAADDVGTEIPDSEVSRTGLSSEDRMWLDRAGGRPWHHLQTEHFILHYDKKIFAAKVARLAEQFYDAISADLPDLTDRVSPDRSHIFIFEDPREWKTVVAHQTDTEWQAASYVCGNAMYLQEIGDSSSEKMSVLAHEMTHLVMNRFLPVRLPRWLNEGLAEYYGEFAYRAVRGLGQSKSAAFKPLSVTYPLQQLFAATAYPTDLRSTQIFYATSKYVVGYLLLKKPRDLWYACFDRILQGESATNAILSTYGYPSIEAFEKDFLKFTH